MRLLLSSAAALAISGCATAVSHYAAAPEDEPYSYYHNGVPIIGSEGEASRVSLGPAMPTQTAADRQYFFVEVVNTGSRPFTVGPENFLVLTEKGEQILVLTPERLKREANRKAAWLKFEAELEQVGNSLNAANAGYSYGHATYSGRTSYSSQSNFNVYGNGGSVYGTANTSGSAHTFGQASYSSYDGSAAAAAQFAADAENRAVRAEYAARIDEVLRNAEDGAFHRHTLAPGQSVMSLVLFDRMPMKTANLTVQVTIGDDVHSFSWTRRVE